MGEHKLDGAAQMYVESDFGPYQHPSRFASAEWESSLFSTLANLNPATREAQRGQSKANLWIIQRMSPKVSNRKKSGNKCKTPIEINTVQSCVRAEFLCNLSTLQTK